MFCPKCGKQQVNEQVRFCSGCGLLLTGVGLMIARDGMPDNPINFEGGEVTSPRKKGLKTGFFLFLSTFLIVPLIALITIAAHAEPFFVAAAAIITFWGGILRMIYALLFESNQPGLPSLEKKVISSTQNYLSKKPEAPALPPQQTVPANNYVPPAAGNWRDTNDLAVNSVTEETTNLLSDRKFETIE
ncbi:MAG: hypothetical protein R2747_04210 [Pyrinomonadaceae bacterium]